jgi:hypothetical protein
MSSRNINNMNMDAMRLLDPLDMRFTGGWTLVTGDCLLCTAEFHSLALSDDNSTPGVRDGLLST